MFANARDHFSARQQSRRTGRRRSEQIAEACRRRQPLVAANPRRIANERFYRLRNVTLKRCERLVILLHASNDLASLRIEELHSALSNWRRAITKCAQKQIRSLVAGVLFFYQSFL